VDPLQTNPHFNPRVPVERSTATCFWRFFSLYLSPPTSPTNVPLKSPAHAQSVVAQKQKPLSAQLPPGHPPQRRMNQKRLKAPKPRYAKRPIGAYFFFLSLNREQFMRDYGLSTVGAMAKKGSELWGRLTDEEKGPYATLAATDLDRYWQEVQVYGIKPKKTKEVRAVKKRVGPKRPLNAFVLFRVEQGKQICQTDGLTGSRASVRHTSRHLASVWRQMPAEERASWEEKARALRTAYDEEVRTYRAALVASP